MKTKSSTFAQKFSRSLGAMLPSAVIIIGLAASSQAAAYKLISNFDGTNGAFPRGNLISDASGNFYGVTEGGGIVNAGCPQLYPTSCGNVFKLTKTSGTAWTITVLYEFTGGSDGGNPLAGLVLDRAGNLYGTTYAGGLYGQGVAFELSPASDGTWNETVLHAFGSGTDGAFPAGSLIFDRSGNLYGTTVAGGTNCGFGIACGTVFELSPNSGDWSETVIYNFASVADGMNPSTGLIFDKHGSLYGTTSQGGNLSNANCGYPYYGCGTVFRLSPNPVGGWRKTTLHEFDDVDGAYPASTLIFDGAGNLYGTASLGGDATPCGGQIPGCGVVFRLSPRSTGGWTETVLRAFQPKGGNVGYGGGRPAASLTQDAAGNLYGTAGGGGHDSVGVVFKLSLNSVGEWTETVLHSFSLPSGSDPLSGLTPDAAGNLLGTTAVGGNASDCQPTGCGVVFEIRP